MAMAAIAAAMLASSAAAAETADLTRCEAIQNEGERLRCFDTAARKAPPSGLEPFGTLSEVSPAQMAENAHQPTALSHRWELDPETKQGTWLMRPYKQIFILPVRYTDRPNDSPQSPTHPETTVYPLDRTEAEFQISFKVKAAQDLFWNGDLWFAYSQQSQWQVYNSSISRPFRETNYMPELFMVFPTRYELLGLTGRFIQPGYIHQSNGRADPLSRSWNRVYVNFGFERGDFALYVRPWYRLREPIEDDDNPDINHYMGYGDITAIYKWGRQEASLVYRPAGSGGSLQGTWSFPVQGRLKGFVKIFHGYGETMIDYNWRQTTYGVGILLVEWL